MVWILPHLKQQKRVLQFIVENGKVLIQSTANNWNII